MIERANAVKAVEILNLDDSRKQNLEQLANTNSNSTETNINTSAIVITSINTIGSVNKKTNNKAELKTTFLITFQDLAEFPPRLKKVISTMRKRRSGYVLIALLFYVFVISLLAIMDPMLATALNLKSKWLHSAINRAEHLAWSTTSPIRNRLVDEVYGRVQTQLINHIAKSKGSVPYECQGMLTQPESEGGMLETQFGLCQPEALLDNLSGLSDQTIDYLPVLYPEHKVELSGENEIARQAIIAQNQNSYEYKLTNTYVGQQTIENKTFKTKTGIKRQEYYHWLVRADIEAKLTRFRNVIRGITVYYDVTLTNNYYPDDFGGGGNLCERSDNVRVGQCPVDIDPLGLCQQTSYTDGNGVEWMAGTGPCPGLGSGDAGCATSGECTDHGAFVTCPLASGGQAVTIKARSTRPQIGCASLNSGRAGRTVDESGYTFVLVVRIVSIGNTFN